MSPGNANVINKISSLQSYSLFIVGFTSLIGSINNLRKGEVNIKAALVFEASSMVTVLLIRKFLIPIIPKNLITINGFTVTESLLTMVLFGVIRDKNTVAFEKECSDCVKFFKALGYGVSIGLVTGLLGAGGGFLLIPALVHLIKLPMKKAIATSLFIISLNSLIGFTGDLGHFKIHWAFLLIITLIAVIGVFVEDLLVKKSLLKSLKRSLVGSCY
ncbi:MAG: permease [Sphingobacteriales bacterium]|nr:permease [Sphingobacteriales bacterium]